METPIALVHDMGKGILSAVAAVFPGKPDFICHFHFLRDIGKDLMEDEYKKIRNRLKKHKIRGSLRRMAKSLEGAAIQDPRLMERLNDNIKNGNVTTMPIRLTQKDALGYDSVHVRIPPDTVRVSEAFS